MAQLVKVDKAAIHDDSPLVLGHRKDIELDLGRLAVLQDIGFDIVEPIVDRMRIGLLPRHAPPPGRPNCPADLARLLSLRTCAREVSHE